MVLGNVWRFDGQESVLTDEGGSGYDNTYSSIDEESRMSFTEDGFDRIESAIGNFVKMTEELTGDIRQVATGHWLEPYPSFDETSGGDRDGTEGWTTLDSSYSDTRTSGFTSASPDVISAPKKSDVSRQQSKAQNIFARRLERIRSRSTNNDVSVRPTLGSEVQGHGSGRSFSFRAPVLRRHSRIGRPSANVTRLESVTESCHESNTDSFSESSDEPTLETQGFERVIDSMLGLGDGRTGIMGGFLDVLADQEELEVIDEYEQSLIQSLDQDITEGHYVQEDDVLTVDMPRPSADHKGAIVPRQETKIQDQSDFFPPVYVTGDPLKREVSDLAVPVCIDEELSTAEEEIEIKLEEKPKLGASLFRRVFLKRNSNKHRKAGTLGISLSNGQTPQYVDPAHAPPRIAGASQVPAVQQEGTKQLSVTETAIVASSSSRSKQAPAVKASPNANKSQEASQRNAEESDENGVDRHDEGNPRTALAYAPSREGGLQPPVTCIEHTLDELFKSMGVLTVDKAFERPNDEVLSWGSQTRGEGSGTLATEATLDRTEPSPQEQLTVREDTTTCQPMLCYTRIDEDAGEGESVTPGSVNHRRGYFMAGTNPGIQLEDGDDKSRLFPEEKTEEPSNNFSHGCFHVSTETAGESSAPANEQDDGAVNEQERTIIPVKTTEARSEGTSGSWFQQSQSIGACAIYSKDYLAADADDNDASGVRRPENTEEPSKNPSIDCSQRGHSIAACTSASKSDILSVDKERRTVPVEDHTRQPLEGQRGCFHKTNSMTGCTAFSADSTLSHDDESRISPADGAVKPPNESPQGCFHKGSVISACTTHSEDDVLPDNEEGKIGSSENNKELSKERRKGCFQKSTSFAGCSVYSDDKLVEENTKDKTVSHIRPTPRCGPLVYISVMTWGAGRDEGSVCTTATPSTATPPNPAKKNSTLAPEVDDGLASQSSLSGEDTSDKSPQHAAIVEEPERAGMLGNFFLGCSNTEVVKEEADEIPSESSPRAETPAHPSGQSGAVEPYKPDEKATNQDEEPRHIRGACTTLGCTTPANKAAHVATLVSEEEDKTVSFGGYNEGRTGHPHPVELRNYLETVVNREKSILNGTGPKRFGKLLRVASRVRRVLKKRRASPTRKIASQQAQQRNLTKKALPSHDVPKQAPSNGDIKNKKVTWQDQPKKKQLAAGQAQPKKTAPSQQVAKEAPQKKKQQTHHASKQVPSNVESSNRHTLKQVHPENVPSSKSTLKKDRPKKNEASQQVPKQVPSKVGSSNRQGTKSSKQDPSQKKQPRQQTSKQISTKQGSSNQQGTKASTAPKSDQPKKISPSKASNRQDQPKKKQPSQQKSKQISAKAGSSNQQGTKQDQPNQASTTKDVAKQHPQKVVLSSQEVEKRSSPRNDSPGRVPKGEGNKHELQKNKPRLFSRKKAKSRMAMSFTTQKRAPPTTPPHMKKSLARKRGSVMPLPTVATKQPAGDTSRSPKATNNPAKGVEADCDYSIEVETTEIWMDLDSGSITSFKEEIEIDAEEYLAKRAQQGISLTGDKVDVYDRVTETSMANESVEVDVNEFRSTIELNKKSDLEALQTTKELLHSVLHDLKSREAKEAMTHLNSTGQVKNLVDTTSTALEILNIYMGAGYNPGASRAPNPVSDTQKIEAPSSYQKGRARGETNHAVSRYPETNKDVGHVSRSFDAKASPEGGKAGTNMDEARIKRSTYVTGADSADSKSKPNENAQLDGKKSDPFVTLGDLINRSCLVGDMNDMNEVKMRSDELSYSEISFSDDGSEASEVEGVASMSIGQLDRLLDDSDEATEQRDGNTPTGQSNDSVHDVADQPRSQHFQVTESQSGDVSKPDAPREHDNSNGEGGTSPQNVAANSSTVPVVNENTSTDAGGETDMNCLEVASKATADTATISESQAIEEKKTRIGAVGTIFRTISNVSSIRLSRQQRYNEMVSPSLPGEKSDTPMNSDGGAGEKSSAPSDDGDDWQEDTGYLAGHRLTAKEKANTILQDLSNLKSTMEVIRNNPNWGRGSRRKQSTGLASQTDTTETTSLLSYNFERLETDTFDFSESQFGNELADSWIHFSTTPQEPSFLEPVSL